MLLNIFVFMQFLTNPNVLDGSVAKHSLRLDLDLGFGL